MEQQPTQELQTLKTLQEEDVTGSAGITGFAECAEIAGIAGTRENSRSCGNHGDTRGLQGRHPEGSASRLRLFHQF
ncbi:MAG: hypothetical protein ACLVGL_16535 [Waltera sp.]